MKHSVFIICLVGMLLALHCNTDKPLPSGYDTLQRQDKGEVLIFQAPLTQAARYWAPITAGSAPHLLLGEQDGVQSRIALLFSNLTTIDTTTIISATLNLNQTALIGTGTAFNGTIHPITALWTETTVSWKDLENSYDLVTSFPYTATAADSGVITAAIDPVLVNGWKSGTANYGLMLTFDQAAFMLKIPSSENSSSWATLDIVYAPKAGGLDTVTISTDQDASLLKDVKSTDAYTLEDEQQGLTLGDGTGYRFLLRFDVSALPINATIHRSLLSLTTHEEISSTDSAGISLMVRPVVTDSAWQDLSTMKFDSLYSSPTATATQDGLVLQISATPSVGYVGAMTQRWVLGLQPNYGILVQSTQYGYDIEKINFYGRADAETKRPSLLITYSLPPSPRF